MRIALIIFILALGCKAVKPSGNDDRASQSTAETEQNSDDVVVGDPQSKSIGEIKGINNEALRAEAFDTTVFPLLTGNCASCHAEDQSPKFAGTDPLDSLKSLEDNAKINLDSPDQSRIVRKLIEQNHNCWSGGSQADCDADGATLAAAITEFVEKAAAATQDEPEIIIESAALATANAVQVPDESGSDTILLSAMDYDSIAAPWITRDDDPDGDVLEYLVCPDNMNEIIQDVNAPGSEVVYTFDVPKAGSYAVYGRTRSANSNDNSFRITVDDNPPMAWATPDDNEWAWARSNQNNDINDPVTFDLTAGEHTVVIQMREDETKFNRLAITRQLENFQGTEIVEDIYRLEYDLSDLTDGKTVTLTIDVSEFDDASNTILVANPRIFTDSPLKVKDLMPVINGSFNPQHATFRIIDQDITPSAEGTALSGASMILIGEDGYTADQLSWRFGTLE